MRNKKVIFFSFILDFLFILAALIVGITTDFSREGARISFLILGVSSVINLIFISIFEYKLNNYHAKRFTLILHATNGVLAVAGIYVLNYADNYDDYKIIYLLIVYGLILLSTVIFTVLNYTIKEKNKKVLVNNTRK